MKVQGNIKKITVETYNKSAVELTEYFRGIGPRVEDIEYTIKLAREDNPNILEIGCGDGRDAKEISKRAKSYTGFDISSELIKLAKSYVPDSTFIVADATRYDYGYNKHNVVFAFASLLHLDIDEVKDVINKVHKSLKKDGVFFISLKYAEKYTAKIKEDKFGKRIFYYYNQRIISTFTKEKYNVIDRTRGFTTGGNTKWIELALVKK